MARTVVEDPGAGRFDLLDDGVRVGSAGYRVDESTVVVDHVQTDPAHRGKGCAAELMAGLLDQLRSSGRSITPLCSYAVAYLSDHPDQHDLLG